MVEAALLQRVYEMGRLGQKTEAGFYDYPGASPSPQVAEAIASLQEGQVEHPSSTFSVERLMAALLNEAFLCVEEQIATIEDIDTACIAGLGMSVRQGEVSIRVGPLEYADSVGLDVVLEQMEQLEQTLGKRFRPAQVLVDKVHSGDLGLSAGRGFRHYRR